MNKQILLGLIILSFNNVFSQGFLGKKGELKLDIHQLWIDRTLDIEYSFLKRRNFAWLVGTSISAVSHSFDESPQFIFKNGDLDIKGCDLKMGLLYGNPLFNDIIPIGNTIGAVLSFGVYSFSLDDQRGNPYGYEFTNESYTSLGIEVVSRQTVNVYKNLNLFYSFSIGYNGVVSSSLTNEAKDQLNGNILVRRRGIIKNYSLGTDSRSPRQNIFLKIGYGITILL